MTIDATLDHAAVAVEDFDRAEARWRHRLGGRRLARYTGDDFEARQYLYRNGAKLELLAPPAVPPQGNFVRAFLDRHGAAMHHVTLKVANLDAAVANIRREGYDVVELGHVGTEWREGFLRPSQVGGIVVQLAWSALTEEEWRQKNSFLDLKPPSQSAAFSGVVLEHPDPAESATLWSLLGATVRRSGQVYECRWDGAALGVDLWPGRVAGPRGLVFEGTPPLRAEDAVGPAVVLLSPGRADNGGLVPPAWR